MSLHSIDTFSTSFLKKKQVGKNVWSFYFKKPTNFEYQAGQYMNITLPVQNGREETYSFTISSAPYEKQLALTTNKTETPFKEELFSLVEEKEVKIRGSIGGFTFDKNAVKPLVFLSGGVGITPFRSIILEFAHNNSQTPITLLASFSKKEDVLFYDELTRLKSDSRKIIYTVTSENSSGFEIGRISEDLIKKYVSNSSSAEFGLAGRGEMVDDLVVILRGMGVENTNIKTDIFTGL